MIKVALLHDNARIPSIATPGAVGYDLHSIETVTLPPGVVSTVRTGLTIEFPADLIMSIRPRSGLSRKGVIVILGTIDPDYRGELIVTILNMSGMHYLIRAFDRIAQLTFEATLKDRLEMRQVPLAALTQTERGVAGFGSSGR